MGEGWLPRASGAGAGWPAKGAARRTSAPVFFSAGMADGALSPSAASIIAVAAFRPFAVNLSAYVSPLAASLRQTGAPLRALISLTQPASINLPARVLTAAARA